MHASEAMCRDCGWSAPYLVPRPAPTRRDISFTERYRGTPFQAPPPMLVIEDPGIAKGRARVFMAMVATFTLIALIVFSQPGM
ncbi:hypothetical protein BH23CHL8_BH23CHL8_26180 [soil metagenome]